MTIKIFDLELKESLLTELSENDTSKICGGAGASEENLASQAANAESAKRFQEQSTAISTDANYAIKADQAFQSLVKQIKPQ